MTRAAGVVVLVALVLAGGAPSSASAAEPPPLPTGPGAPDEPRLTSEQATDAALAAGKVRRWLERYPPDPTTRARFDRETRRWTVKAWSGEAGQIAEVVVEDSTGRVLEAWTGPQVAWRMARGYRGSFGGDVLNHPAVWWALVAVFVLGLADLRRPLSLGNLDLVALAAFAVSFEAFNLGAIFWSVPLVYPPLVYLLARMAWIGFRPTAAPALRPVWPVWALAAAVAFVGGFRIGLNVEESGVIDVGYASVIGAHRILHGEAPWGHMPVRRGTRCGPDADEPDPRERIQTNGRCETANERGDTYGPTTYLAYVPAVGLLGWEGRWDGLPSAHLTAIALDLAVLLGLVLVGRRHGGLRLAVTLAFAWVAYPFTTYVLATNANDALVPALLVWGYLLATSDTARGAFAGLASWAKFATLVTVPLWLGYPAGVTRRRALRFGAGFAAATLAVGSVLLLEPDLLEAVRAFVERTLGYQLGRDSPFSLWGWGQYHAAGIPDLAWLQRVLQVTVVAFALLLAVRPREKGPLQLAALTAAALLAFEGVLTHWFYLYLPWIAPFVLLAILLPRPESAAHVP